MTTQGDLFAAPPGTEAKTQPIVPTQHVYSRNRLPHLAEHLSGVTFHRDNAGKLIREEYEYVVPGKESVEI